MFNGDFKQILPVIVKGTWPEIVGACIQKSRLWQFVKVLKLTENMHVNTTVEAEKHFAKWQLDVGHGTFTNELGSITLPNQFRCTENTVASLIQTIYPEINLLLLLPDQYFAEHTILTSRNDDVDDINSEMAMMTFCIYLSI